MTLRVSPDAFLELAGATAEARADMGAAGRAYVTREHNIEHLGETFAAVVEGRLPAGPAAVQTPASRTTSSSAGEPPTA